MAAIYYFSMVSLVATKNKTDNYVRIIAKLRNKHLIKALYSVSVIYTQNIYINRFTQHP